MLNMIKGKCEVCKKTFFYYLSNQKGRYCSRNCYFRNRKGENTPHWHGGKFIDNGYVWVRKPAHPLARKTGYVCEHRLVMEKKIGRFLKKGEVVHHINGIRNDNRIENLILLTTGNHAREHIDHLKQFQFKKNHPYIPRHN